MFMYKIGHLGQWESVPPLIAAIYHKDFETLQKLIEDGADINQKLRISANVQLYPLEVAVYQNNAEMTKVLLGYGAKSKLAYPHILYAVVRYADAQIAKIFVDEMHGLGQREKVQLFRELGWGNHFFQNAEILENAGITAKKYAGAAFRETVFKNNIDYVRLLMKKGVNVDFCESDSIFETGETALSVAAEKNNFLLVKELVEYGADVTVCNRYGERAYDCAIQAKNKEMAEYLKAHEPQEWHSDCWKEKMLKPYRLPKTMVEYLNTQPLRIEFENEMCVKWLQMYSYTDIKEVVWNGQKMLSIVQETDGYGKLFKLFWNPKDSLLYGVDTEHEEMIPFCGWEEFIADPAKWLNPKGQATDDEF